MALLLGWKTVTGMDKDSTLAAHARNITRASQPSQLTRQSTVRLDYGQEKCYPLGHGYRKVEGRQLGFHVHPAGANWKDAASWASEVARCTRAAWMIWHCECANEQKQCPNAKTLPITTVLAVDSLAWCVGMGTRRASAGRRF